MGKDNLDVYRTVLRHVVRPDDMTERKDSPSVLLEGWQALWLRGELLDYAHYYSNDDTEERIALAYAEYINMIIRDERQGAVTLYAHTNKAWTVLLECSRISPDVKVSEIVSEPLTDAFIEAADEGQI